jgi:hypothetical protein
MINLAGRLLGLQSIGFLLLAAFLAPDPPIPAHQWDELWQPGVFAFLAITAVTSALGILRLRPLAWDIAMFMQGACLLLALTLYAGARPVYVYAMMIFSIVLVLVLNQVRRSVPTEIIPLPEDVSLEL